MNEDEAENEEKKGNFVVEAEGGYRRIVPAPKPLDIVEIDAIRTLADADQVVIACGGGGIPVLVQENNLKGASAVIEKDLAAGKLAEMTDADILLILTAEEQLALNYNSDNKELISSVSVEQARKYMEEGQFGIGTKLPKIEAAVDFVGDSTEKRAVITNLLSCEEALLGRAGTIVKN